MIFGDGNVAMAGRLAMSTKDTESCDQLLSVLPQMYCKDAACLISFFIVVTKYLKNQLKGTNRFWFSLKGFGPWLAGSMGLRSVARQKHHGRRPWWRNIAHLGQPGAEQETGKSQGQSTPFKGHAPSDILPSARPHLLAAHSAVNSME
jgi:hypothetical protein